MHHFFFVTQKKMTHLSPIKITSLYSLHKVLYEEIYSYSICLFADRPNHTGI